MVRHGKFASKLLIINCSRKVDLFSWISTY